MPGPGELACSPCTQHMPVQPCHTPAPTSTSPTPRPAPPPPMHRSVCRPRPHTSVSPLTPYQVPRHLRHLHPSPGLTAATFRHWSSTHTALSPVSAPTSQMSTSRLRHTEGLQLLDLRFLDSASATGGRPESNAKRQHLEAPGDSMRRCTHMPPLAGPVRGSHSRENACMDLSRAEKRTRLEDVNCQGSNLNTLTCNTLRSTPPQPPSGLLTLHTGLWLPALVSPQSTVNPAARGTSLSLNQITSLPNSSPALAPHFHQSLAVTHQDHPIHLPRPPLSDLTSYHTLPLSFHWLQRPCLSLNAPGPILPQGFCTSCSLCPEVSSPRILHGSPRSVLLRCHLLSEALLDYPT